MEYFISKKELAESLGITTRALLKMETQGRIKLSYIKKLGYSYQKLVIVYEKHIAGWLSYNLSGLESKAWSTTYAKTQELTLRRYLKKYPSISTKALKDALLKVPKEQRPKRIALHNAVSSFAKYLSTLGLVSETEIIQIKALYPKKDNYYRPRQRYLETEEVETILESLIPNRLLYTVTVLLSESALRVSEACNLKVSELTFNHNITKASIFVVVGKGGKSRKVPFSLRCQGVLGSWISEMNRTNYLFHGVPPLKGRLTKDYLQKQYAKLSAGAWSAHSFRHYRITLWANKPGVPINAVRLWAGHSDLKTTQKYIHVLDEDALSNAF